MLRINNGSKAFQSNQTYESAKSTTNRRRFQKLSRLPIQINAHAKSFKSTRAILSIK